MEERAIPEILNLESGRIQSSEEFFAQPESVIFEARYHLQRCIKEEKRYLVCPLCRQPLVIRGKPAGIQTLHFRHFYNSGDCPWKTTLVYTKEQIERMKYNGQKESIRHQKMKEFLVASLSVDPSFSEIKKEEVFHHKGIEKEWRKPDVSAKINGFDIVFEIQLSTTFLSTVVERDLFYKENHTFIMWVFDQFIVDEAQQRFTEKDVIYSNNCNAFVVSNETLSNSQQHRQFYLSCFYREPVIENGRIAIYWRQQDVSFHDLTFNYDSYKLFYFDFNTTYVTLTTKLRWE